MIKIEVTGNTIPELADKLLAIGASLQNTITVYDTPARKTPPKKAEVMQEVVEVAPVDPAPAAAEEEELEVVDLPVDTPDLEIDIKALVLKVVVKRGKPFMEAILSSFGVVKASHIKPALLPKLVDLCHEALA